METERFDLSDILDGEDNSGLDAENEELYFYNFLGDGSDLLLQTESESLDVHNTFGTESIIKLKAHSEAADFHNILAENSNSETQIHTEEIDFFNILGEEGNGELEFDISALEEIENNLGNLTNRNTSSGGSKRKTQITKQPTTKEKLPKAPFVNFQYVPPAKIVAKRGRPRKQSIKCLREEYYNMELEDLEMVEILRVIDKKWPKKFNGISYAKRGRPRIYKNNCRCPNCTPKKDPDDDYIPQTKYKYLPRKSFKMGDVHVSYPDKKSYGTRSKKNVPKS
jgi:hypothetical protein